MGNRLRSRKVLNRQVVALVSACDSYSKAAALRQLNNEMLKHEAEVMKCK